MRTIYKVLLALALSLLLPHTTIAQDSPERVAELQAALQSEKAEDRIRAANSLAQMGSAAQAAIPDLIPLLNDKDVVVRTRVVIALRNLATPARADLLPLFLSRLEDNDPAFRVHLDRTVIRYGTAATTQLLAKLSAEDVKPAFRARVLNVLALLGPDAKDAVPAMSKILDSENVEERLLAAHVLGRIGPYGADGQKGLITMLESKDRRQIIGAAEALQGIKAAAIKSGPALLANLKNDDFEVRWNCALALGMVDPSLPEPVATLVREGATGQYRAQAALLQLVMDSTKQQGHLEVLKSTGTLTEREKKLVDLVFRELERRSE